MMEQVRSIHLSGICGTAMGSCAAALKAKGYQVTGSDQGVYSPMSDFLADQGIAIRSPYAEENVAHRPDLVVIGNALSRGNPEVEYILAQKLPYCSLPELLKEVFIRGKRSVVIGGTHGKTTTASLMAWVFETAGRNPSFLIGGVPGNFGCGARFTDSPWIILEGDEYDTAFFDKRSKFLHYLPEIGVFNNLEFDHADIFEDLAAIRLSFQRFAKLIPRNGLLLINGDDLILREFLEVRHCPAKSFGLEIENQTRAEHIQLRASGSAFQVNGVPYTLPLLGRLNVQNALAVIACARHCGIDAKTIQEGLSTFQGIRRRMEVLEAAGGVTIVDDFGHHPTAIRETIAALRSAYSGRRLWAAFEPRSNTTRRNVFQTELADALSAADGVVFSQIDRLWQLSPSQRLNPEQLAEDIRRRGKPCEYLADADAVCRYLAAEARPQDVVCIFSNRSFGNLHGKLEQALKQCQTPVPSPKISRQNEM